MYSTPQFLDLWELCMEYSKLAFASTGSKTERVKLINYVAHSAPKIHSTYYFTQINSIINNIAELVNTFSWQQKDPTRMAFLNVVNALIENNSKRQGNLLLENFYYLSEKLVGVILELVTSWRHSLRSEDLDELVYDLVKVNRKIFKKDDKLELFMRILGSCFIDKRDIPSTDYDELWNYAISLLQIPTIQEAARIAISGIIHYYDEVLTAKPDDLFKVLIFQIAQFSIYSKPVLDLIHLAITKFEFDERASFRVDLQNSCPEWIFRSQLLCA
uniref:Uncharacterized protein n=1 Tax=Panagrolaimus sp. ES5 TaxID=591445 RepID=A0AC34F7U6_9BILA